MWAAWEHQMSGRAWKKVYWTLRSFSFCDGRIQSQTLQQNAVYHQSVFVRWRFSRGAHPYSDLHADQIKTFGEAVCALLAAQCKRWRCT